MRFILSRIFKNFPIINNIWLSYIENSNFKYYDKHCKNYKIIPFGNYCLPRVITTINRLKPTKKYGEKSFPFDLCFSKFETNVKLFSENFEYFFENISFDQNKKYWINNDTNMIFNHDGLLSLDEFKQRYKNRIGNLYDALNDKSIHIFFIVATFEEIAKLEIEKFLNLIKQFRESDTYDLIMINQSNVVLKFDFTNVHFINLERDKSFTIINKDGNWVNELKRMKNFHARVFNYKIKTKLSKIIRSFS